MVVYFEGGEEGEVVWVLGFEFDGGVVREGVEGEVFVGV